MAAWKFANTGYPLAIEEIAPISLREVVDYVPLSESVTDPQRRRPKGFCINANCVERCDDPGRVHLIRCHGLGVISMIGGDFCAKCQHALFWTWRHQPIRAAEARKVRTAARRAKVDRYQDWDGEEEGGGE